MGTGVPGQRAKVGGGLWGGLVWLLSAVLGENGHFFESLQVEQVAMGMTTFSHTKRGDSNRLKIWCSWLLFNTKNKVYRMTWVCESNRDLCVGFSWLFTTPTFEQNLKNKTKWPTRKLFFLCLLHLRASARVKQPPFSQEFSLVAPKMKSVNWEY